MADIVLITLNARYAHASFGLRYLMANLTPQLRERAAMLEFDIGQRTVDVVEAVLAQRPRIVGVGVYIWNAQESLRLVADLKRIAPHLIVVLGGPEVSYETEQQEVVSLADYVVAGEADLALSELCEKLLSGKRPLQKIIAAALPEFGRGEVVKEGTEGRRDKGTEGECIEEGTEGRRDKGTEGGVDAHAAGMTDPLVPLPLRPSVPQLLRPSLRSLALPYHLYTDTDLAHRVVYVEASRGCPFKCEFCLSSLDVPVRNAPIELFLAEMQKLLDRGLMQFKFVDRTFNLNLNISRAILEFFLERYRPGLFLHFEMIPDRLPEALRTLIARFPPGTLQFEVGIQTFNAEVSARISRRQDNERLAENLRFLRESTGVHVHADLIVGLPGEDVESFGRGFDRLVALRPQEIQVGILKRLRGTPIVRHDAEFGMVYSPNPPYEVLKTRDIDFGTMQRLRRFARYWDLIANSGNFIETTPLIWGGGTDGRAAAAAGPFASFLRLSDWLFETAGRKHGIALKDLAGLLLEHLTTVGGQRADAVAPVIWRDYQRGGRSDVPPFLRPHVKAVGTRQLRRQTLAKTTVPVRQARHLGP